MEWNIAHRNLIHATEFNFNNYPIRNILGFLYVTECSHKCVQKIQLTKQQKEFLSDHRQPPQKPKSFFKARATFLSPGTNLVIPQSEKN